MIAVQKYIDKHHSLFCKFGALIGTIFLVIYVPATIQVQLNTKAQENQELHQQIENLNSQVNFYKTAYAKQLVVQKEIECLAKNIYFEAANESRAGKIAVAEVTVNRVKRGFAKTICGVVNQKSNGTCQFSWVCQPKKAITMHSQWKESREIAEDILILQKKYSTIHGAMFFHADYVSPMWAQTKEFVRKIGRHMFYKD